MSDDTYQGAANRETWAFNLHWQNDQGIYNQTLEYAGSVMADLDESGNDLDRGDGYGSSVTDYGLGERVVDYWIDIFDGYEDGTPMPATLRMFRNEVGSFWRVDRIEVGAAVRESLDIESDD